MMYSVGLPGKYGIIQDADPFLTPKEAWTAGNNVRFSLAQVEKITGEETNFNPTLTDIRYITNAIHWEGTPTVSVPYWVTVGLDKAYAYAESVDNNITRQETGTDVDYTGTDTNLWNGCQCQNLLYLTNGVDSPQVWDGETLVNMRWDSGNTWDDMGYTTKLLRTYKNFVIALQFNDDTGNGNNPMKVYWSEPAEPWIQPTTWDYTIGTNLSGMVDLAATPGEILDAAPLRDYLVIYKQDAVVLMSYVGGQSVFNFRTISKANGILATHCVQEFDGQHFVVGINDVYVTDGNSFKSVIDGYLRKKLFSEIDPTYYVKTFVAVNREKTEMWVCYPTTGSTSCNRALIWNWQNGSWSIRDLPNIHYIANGILPSEDPYIWSADTETWAEDTTAWDERSYNPTVVKNMGVSDDTTYVFDSGYTFGGNSYSSYVEKQWITLGSPDTIKRIKSVYIKGKGEMNVYVGHAMHQYDAFTWEGPYNLDPSLDAQIRCRVTGRYHAIRFEFVGDSEHSIQGYDIEYVDTGYGR